MSGAASHPPRNGRGAHGSASFVTDGDDLIVRPSTDDAHAQDAAELARVLNSLQATLPSRDIVGILTAVGDALRHDDDAAHSSLTTTEAAALRAAGSLVEPAGAPSIAERPSVQTAIRQQVLLSDALTTEDVARLLDVSTGRIRQRRGEGSLLAMRGSGRGLRFPRFQFTDDGELPGWGTVCKALPDQANPVAVEYFLTHTHPDLADGELSPAQWLAAGKPAEFVATLADQVFTIR